MAGFMYIIEGVELDRETADQAVGRSGLRYAAPNGYSAHAIARGPGGKPGVLVVPNIERDGSAMPTPLFTPAGQVWVEKPKAEMGDGDPGGSLNASVWVGWERDHPPTPDDLIRKETVRGSPILLGDGNLWDVPIAVVWPSGASAFPKRLALGPGGQWVTEPLERFRAVSDQAGRLLAEGPGHEISDQEAIAMAVEALGVNYRVGPVECSALGLLTSGATGTVTKILRAFVGSDEIERLAAVMAESKKNGSPTGIPPG